MVATDVMSREMIWNSENKGQNETSNVALTYIESELSQIRNATIEDSCLQSLKEVVVQSRMMDKRILLIEMVLYFKFRGEQVTEDGLISQIGHLVVL